MNGLIAITSRQTPLRHGKIHYVTANPLHHGCYKVQVYGAPVALYKAFFCHSVRKREVRNHYKSNIIIERIR